LYEKGYEKIRFQSAMTSTGDDLYLGGLEG